MTTAANAVQIGGTHYASAYQHWDLVIDLKLDYFEAQVTKYVTRHHKKHGKQDLEKAIHFARKAHEAASAGRLEMRHLTVVPSAVTLYCDTNQLGEAETRCILLACSWAGAKDLAWLVLALKELLQLRYPAAEEGEPTSGYVDQGRDK